MVLAGREKVTSNKAALEFYEKAEVSGKEYKMEENALHLIIQEGGLWETVVKDIIAW